MKKKIVLAYTKKIDNYIIFLLKKKHFDVIIFFFDLGQKINFENYIKKNNFKIKNFFFKDIKNEFCKKYIFSLLNYNLEYLNYSIFEKIIISIIAKEILKICYYTKTKYIFNNFTNIKHSKYFFKSCKYFNYKINILNLKTIYFFNKKIFFNKKNFIFNNIIFNIFKYKNNFKKNFLKENESLYPIYLTLTLKNNKFIKINNINYIEKNIFEKLNILGLLNNIGKIIFLKNNIFYKKYNKIYEFPGLKILIFLKKFLDKLILKKDFYFIKKKVSLFFFNFLEKELWWSFKRFFFQKIVNYFNKYFNCIIKIKIFNKNINILKVIY